MKKSELCKILLGNTIKFLLPLLAFFSGVWSIGVVYYNLSRRSRWWTVFYTAVLAGLILRAFFNWQALIVIIIGQLLLLAYFIQLDALESFCNVRWQKPWMRMPDAREYAGIYHIRNLRDFHYRSEEDYDVRYRKITVDPAGVKSVDLILSYWDGMRSVAHTMLSFGFDDGTYLAVSMETRLPQGVTQGFLPGLYKQYGLIMVLGTEEDLLKLRTDFRKEELYLYRTNATAAQGEKLLRNLLGTLQDMQREPRFYNSIFRNCTTSLAPLLRVIDPRIRYDLRLLFNGFSDELLFELGYLKHREGETFAALKKRSLVHREKQTEGDYSAAIRADI